MLTLVAVVHILTAVTLILLVLVQDSKGGAMGGMFAGGGSNSILGATGATNLFVKLTRAAAIIFAITCLLLVILSAQERKSVLEGVVLPAQPAVPEAEQKAPESAAPKENTQAPAKK
jgi:preprotein translocase subunit SecG